MPADETPDLMPAPLYYSHKILERWPRTAIPARRRFLGPDAKSQVTLRYENGKPVAAPRSSSPPSTRRKGYDQGDKEARDRRALCPRSCAARGAGCRRDRHINPTGKFVIGGPDGDAA
jgi:S-adenosylmethionine synthetase